jgi:glutamate racemase
MSSQPIGVFDSGVGGTSIWKELHKLLPFESTIYLADSKNAPYGEKSAEKILALSVKNTELLLDKGAKLIVVACNTATTNAITYLRENYNVPFIGIEPAIKPAALNSKSKAIGVLATQGTLSSTLFNNASKVFSEGVKIVEQDGIGLVPLIESGEASSATSKALLLKYLNPMLDEGIDYLVLGCTHYPYLIPVLRQILPAHVKIIDSGEAVAKQIHAILLKNNLLAKKQTPVNQFYTNANVEILTQFVAEYKVEVDYLDF